MFSPWVYRRVVHPFVLRRASQSRRKALKRSEVFLPYFDARVRYDNAKTAEALRPFGIEVPRLGDYFDRLMAFATETQWGRKRLTRPRVEAGASEVGRMAMGGAPPLAEHYG
jgi:hypothetical protein